MIFIFRVFLIIYTYVQCNFRPITSAAQLSTYNGKVIKYSDNPSKQVFLVLNNTLFPVANADTFTSLGFDWGNIIYVQTAALTSYSIGPSIDMYSSDIKVYKTLIENSKSVNYVGSIAIRTYSQETYDNWTPYFINKACPIYVVCRAGDGGFGDRLEHYIYFMNIAKLLQATLVYEVIPEECLKQGHNCGHNPKEYSFIMSEILGINFTFNSSSLESLRDKTTTHRISFPEAKILEESIQNGTAKVMCNSIYESNIYSCNGQWCPTSIDYNFVENVKWHLRTNQAVQACSTLKYGFFPSSNEINVVWHIRNGDICLHCRDVEYIRKIYLMILSSLDMSENESKRRIQFHIESTDPLPELEQSFPMFLFHNNQGLFAEHVCRVLTGDIYISTGSSLVILGAFASINRPIIFEEERKNQHNEVFKQRHIFPEKDVIWMFNGVPSKTFNEVKSILKSSLAFKLINSPQPRVEKDHSIESFSSSLSSSSQWVRVQSNSTEKNKQLQWDNYMTTKQFIRDNNFGTLVDYFETCSRRTSQDILYSWGDEVFISPNVICDVINNKNPIGDGGFLVIGDSLHSHFTTALAAYFSAKPCSFDLGPDIKGDYRYPYELTAKWCICDGKQKLGFIRNDHIDSQAGEGFNCQDGGDRCIRWMKQDVIRQFSVIVLNTGTHFLDDNKFRANVWNAASFLKPLSQSRLIVFRETVPGHALCMNLVTPFADLQSAVNWTEVSHPYYEGKNFRRQNSIASQIFKEFDFSILPVYVPTVLRGDWHIINEGDCLHYCVPGPSSTWLNMLMHLTNETFFNSSLKNR